ncbi:MAG: hypothetical protein AAFX87_18845 [Bacteroidota bacterium]
MPNPISNLVNMTLNALNSGEEAEGEVKDPWPDTHGPDTSGSESESNNIAEAAESAPQARVASQKHASKRLPSAPVDEYNINKTWGIVHIKQDEDIKYLNTRIHRDQLLMFINQKPKFRDKRLPVGTRVKVRIKLTHTGAIFPFGTLVPYAKVVDVIN